MSFDKEAFLRREDKAYKRADGQLGGASPSFGFGYGLRRDNVLGSIQKTSREYICEACGFRCVAPAELLRHLDSCGASS